MTIIAWILFFIGLIVISISVAIFLKCGCRAAVSNLRQTKKIEIEHSRNINEKLYEGFYAAGSSEAPAKNRIAYNNTEKQRGERLIMRTKIVAQDDTALLATDILQGKAAGDDTEKLDLKMAAGEIDNDDTEELVFSSGDTEILKGV